MIEVTSIPVDLIDPNPWNPNVMSDHVMQAARESMQRFGMIDPILVRTKGKRWEIIDGEHRWRVCQERGDETVPGIVVKAKDVEARKMTVILNDIKGRHDTDLLGAILHDLKLELDEDEFNLALPYTADELSALLDQSTAVPPPGDDEIPEPPEVADSKPGEVYELGPHRLICGDALEPGTLAIVLDGTLADLVVTSPPYNQDLQTFKPSGMHGTGENGSPTWAKRMAAAYHDSVPEDEYQAQQVAMLDSLLAVTSPTASVFYNHKHRYRDKVVVSPQTWLARTQWNLRQEIIWARPGSVTQNARMFLPSDERIYWMTRGDFLFNDSTEIKTYSTVWSIAPRIDVAVSAPFPAEIPDRCIRACTKPGDVVLDPYGGSGTTMIAADRLGRSAVLVEIDPRYCDVIRRRWEEHTAK